MHELIVAKVCSRCFTNKSVIEFSKKRTAKDGLKNECKACAAIRFLDWSVLNQEKIKLRSVIRCSENREKSKVRAIARRIESKGKRKASGAAWYASNREMVKARSAAWRVANPDQVKAISTAYQVANPEMGRINNLNRSARKRAAGGKLSKDIAAKLFNLQKGKCPCCGQPLGENYHMDHIMPLARGGANTDENIQLLRQRCNNQKHAKHPVDFMQSRGFLL